MYGVSQRATRKHPVLAAIAALLGIIAVLGCVVHIFPEDMQALPYVPVILAVSPWFALVALISLLCALVSRRWFTAIIAVICIGVQLFWQLPYYRNGESLSEESIAAVNQVKPITDDTYVRVMTCNVYKGAADPQAIVELVRDHHIEILALQETTTEFVDALETAGINDYLPYSVIASSDGVFGNGLWAAQPFQQPADTEFNSSASYMPAGTLQLDGGALPVRFVSVHTTSPTSQTWQLWDRSLTEMQQLTRNTDTQYVLMGDFNATTDHAVFRDLLGARFQDAAETSGHGLVFTWPADKAMIPPFSGIDHIVTERGVIVGQVSTAAVAGSDHRALMATLDFSQL